MLLQRVHKPWRLLKQRCLPIGLYFSPQSSTAHAAAMSQLAPYPKKYYKLPPWLALPPIYQSPNVLEGVETDASAFREAHSKDKLELLFEQKVRAYLVSRCALAGKISDPITKALHFMNKGLIGQFPVYVTSLSLMKSLVQQREDHWTPILHSIVEARVVVLLDWDLELTPIEVTFYDHGLLLASESDEAVTYKAECDGSYKASKNGTPAAAAAAGGGGAADGTATIASIIWKCKELVDSQITRGLPSKSSEHAEAIALLSVLQRGRQLKLKIMDVVMDNMSNYETMIGKKDVFEHKHSDVMIAAIQVAKEYDICRFRHVPRELVCLVNEMAKEGDSALDLETILKIKASCLWGSPVICIKQSRNTIIKHLEKKVVDDVDMKVVQSNWYYVDVQAQALKLRALEGLLSVLCPDFLVVLVRSEESAREILYELSWNYRCFVRKVTNPVDGVVSASTNPLGDVASTISGELGPTQLRTALVLIDEMKIPKFYAEKSLLVMYDPPSDAIQYDLKQDTSGVISVSIVAPHEKVTLPENAREVDPFLYGFFWLGKVGDSKIAKKTFGEMMSRWETGPVGKSCPDGKVDEGDLEE